MNKIHSIFLQQKSNFLTICRFIFLHFDFTSQFPLLCFLNAINIKILKQYSENRTDTLLMQNVTLKRADDQF